MFLAGLLQKRTAKAAPPALFTKARQGERVREP